MIDGVAYKSTVDRLADDAAFIRQRIERLTFKIEEAENEGRREA